MDFATEPTAPDYEVLADELDSIARTVRQNPSINHHLADRLTDLATQLRIDSRIAVPKKKSA
jgi:hypothetical protein